MSKKLVTILEIQELLIACAAIENVEDKQVELNRIAALDCVVAEKVAIAELIAAAYADAGLTPETEAVLGDLVEVKVLQSVGGPFGSFAAGDTASVDEATAASWVKFGLAENI
jgi:hypothetical protein